MAIDIRATVTCSLGTLISGSLSDDYLQNSGLVKTRGTVEISALITPAVGTVVTFTYTKGGVTRNIPRKLRVLSSFADPFRRTTKVEIGCKLTYLSDLQEPIEWDAFDDPENAAYTEDDQRIVTLPIRASSVMDKCLTELGITANSNPLTNQFSVAKFDFGGGYVQVLSDLLVSESYYGYLDTSEILQIQSLDQEGGNGPVFTGSDIIDLGPIGVGQLPGEAVTVSYSTLKLKEPEQLDPENAEDAAAIEKINWELTETVSSVETFQILYKNINGQDPDKVETANYSGITSTVTRIDYKTITVISEDEAALGPEEAQRIEKEVPATRTVTETGPAIAVLGSMAQEYLSNGRSFSAPTIELSKTIETFNYDKFGNQTKREIRKYDAEAVLIGAASVRYVYPEGAIVVSYGAESRETELTIEENETSGNYTKTVVSTYKKAVFTQSGQQQYAFFTEQVSTLSDTVVLIASIKNSGLVHDTTTTTVNRSGASTSQERPSAGDRTNSVYAKGGDPNNGWRTESSAELELALGSATAQRRIELSMPYAPDDRFSGPPGGPFSATPSDAPAKANRFGRVQNRLLLGNRNGINLQVAPERMPAAPFDPIYVQASGLTALYRANGNQWAFDSNGIVCSTDALFWAAVGGTGTFWFPVAPGITTLPVEPPIVDGQMNASNVVLPYNETAIYEGRLRLGNVVTKFNYALDLLTVIPALNLQVPAEVTRIRKIAVPSAASVTLATLVPKVSISVAIKPPASSINIAAPTPSVVSGASVAVPASDTAITALVPESVGRPKIEVIVPSSALTVAAPIPSVVSGASIAVPVKDTTVAAALPSVLIYQPDPNFASVSLLLHLDGADGGTTFTDNSNNVFTMTRGGNAELDTAVAKFGTAAVIWDGTGDFLRTPSDVDFTFGTGDFTIEFWSYFNSSFNTGAAAILMSIGAFRNIMYISNTLRFRTDSGTNLITGGALSLSTWYHIALTKSGNDHKLFIDGTQTGSTYTNTSSYTADRITFGANNTGGSNYLGSMDEIRVTTGVARYTANFTAPTQAFPDS